MIDPKAIHRRVCELVGADPKAPANSRREEDAEARQFATALLRDTQGWGNARIARALGYSSVRVPGDQLERHDDALRTYPGYKARYEAVRKALQQPISERLSPFERISELERENARLRAEVDRLESQRQLSLEGVAGSF